QANGDAFREVPGEADLHGFPLIPVVGKAVGVPELGLLFATSKFGNRLLGLHSSGLRGHLASPPCVTAVGYSAAAHSSDMAWRAGRRAATLRRPGPATAQGRGGTRWPRSSC